MITKRTILLSGLIVGAIITLQAAYDVDAFLSARSHRLAIESLTKNELGLRTNMARLITDVDMMVDMIASSKMAEPSRVDPDPSEAADLRRFSRRDTADNLYSPDDHAEFVGRRDSFDRRPSAAKGATP